MRYANTAAPPIRYDWATGLYRRWYVDAQTQQLLQKAFRTGEPVFVVSVAADTPRDTERLAVCLRAGLPRFELVGVVGPGSFAIVLKGMNRDEVHGLLGLLRGAVGAELQVGIAEFPDDGLSFEGLLRSAMAEPEIAAAA